MVGGRVVWPIYLGERLHIKDHRLVLIIKEETAAVLFHLSSDINEEKRGEI